MNAEAAEQPAQAPNAPPLSRGLVVFDHVRKSYDGHHLVVQDLSLSIAKGEFVTLLGPSGSGKTTSLMMLAGFERPTSGKIFLDDTPVETLPPEKRNIGFVFQNYALFPHMTVAENIAFPLRYRGIKGAAAAQRVERALDMVRLGGLGSRRTAQLSGGQQQRVALARALVFEPRLVLMDEPLGALDKQLRERMQFEIKQIQAKLGLTIIYVTHDQSEALTMSDRVAVFHNGRIQQLSGPIELYNCPANIFVADFIGENNLVPVSLASVAGGRAEATTRDGVRLRAVVARPVAAQNAVVAIRPERITLDVDSLELGDSNLFTGEVRGVVFQGDHIRLQVKALGMEEVAVKCPPVAGHFPAVGDRIRLGCRAENCLMVAE